MKRILHMSTLASAIIIGSAIAASAADEYNVSNGITLTGNPLGLHGVDPVSMFASDAPSTGDAVFTTAHDGVDYYFSTKAAQDKFEAEPAAFLPQFGGFCAFGVYKGLKLDGDVRYADIVDGKLYLFVNAAIYEKYLEDKQTVISGAVDAWPDIRSTAIGDL